MNRRYSAVAVAALALAAAGFAATDASAQRVPDPNPGNATLAPNNPKYDPQHHGNMTTQGIPTTPDCHWAYHPACKQAPVPGAHTRAALNPGPSDDNRADALQTGASALGGAGLAFGGLWLYRRLHASAV